MTLIRRPSPLGDLLSLRSAMDRIFDEPFFRPVNGGTSEDTLVMPLDIYTTQDALVVEAALPGVRAEDVDVTVLGDTLTLVATSGSERDRDQGGYHLREVRRGRFSRSVTLPSGLRTDACTADLENGMLRLSFPKAEQLRPRQIPVTTPVEGAPRAVTAGSGDASHAPDAGSQPAAG